MNDMYANDDIKKKLGIEVAITPKMRNALRTWCKAYTNEADWLNKDVKSLNIPSSIASEIARLVTLECEIKVSGSPKADYINKQLDYIRNEKKNIMEMAGSVGGVIFKPYISGSKIMIDCVYQDEMIPFRYDDGGRITGVIFPSFCTIQEKRYTRLEIHDYTNEKYTISNKCYVSKELSVDTNCIRSLGKEVPLNSVSEWENVEPEVVIAGSDVPWFSFCKIPIANNIERKSPLGVSVYARAINDIKQADIQASRMDWEFESKETAIEMDESYFDEDIYGNKVIPKGKERMYRTYNGETLSDGSKLFKHFSPEIRDESFSRGLDKILKRIEFNCGLAYGTISDPQNVDKTAEEIKSSKQRSYQLIKDIQGSLQNAIENLVHVMDLMSEANGLVTDGNYDLSFTWDDSIVVDAEKERMQDLQDVREGLLPKWKYKVKWQGLSENQAKAELKSEEARGISFPGDEEIDDMPLDDEIIKTAEDTAGKALNGAQTQSLITIIQQYAAGSLTLGQAINVLSTAIGISKDKAKSLIEGTS